MLPFVQEQWLYKEGDFFDSGSSRTKGSAAIVDNARHDASPKKTGGRTRKRSGHDDESSRIF
jgi:hypothetical protein